MNKNDKRYIATEKIIKENYIKLSKSKPGNMISVAELCKLSNINRSSFYLHYCDVNELYQTLEKESFEFIESSFQHYTFDGKIDIIIDMLFNNFQDNTMLLDFLLNVSKVSKQALIDSSKAIAIKEWQKHSSFTDDDASIAYDFIVGGMTAILNAWLNNNFHHPDKYKEMFIKLATEGLHHYVYKDLSQ